MGSWPSSTNTVAYTSHCNGIALSSNYYFFSFCVAAGRGLVLNFNLPQFSFRKVFIVTEASEFMDIYQHKYLIAESRGTYKDIDQVYVVHGFLIFAGHMV